MPLRSIVPASGMMDLVEWYWGVFIAGASIVFVVLAAAMRRRSGTVVVRDEQERR